jgi:hypothetical protein
MNQLTSTHPAFGLAPATHATRVATPPLSAVDALQARFALRVTSALSERSTQLDADITERLRFARENALSRVKQSSAARTDASAVAATNRWRSPLLMKFAAVLPAIALVAGLMLIQRWQDNSQITTAAEVDAALLSDDLPPTAYSDPGFVEFLKSPGQ